MKKLILYVFALCLFYSCNSFRDTPEIGEVLADHFDNKLYRKFDTAAYNQVFQHCYDSLKKDFSNPKTLLSFYKENEHQPGLVTRHLKDGGLDSLVAYLKRSEEHGFTPRVFRTKEISSALDRLKRNDFKKIDELYPILADLELNSAEGLIKYYSYLSFGAINPKKFISRYYIDVKRPSYDAFVDLLKTAHLADRLQKLQPTSAQYLGLQERLMAYEQAPEQNKEAIKIIKINMERLRWQLPETGEEFIEVNIPDFSLTWTKAGDTVTHMKVCVGGRREKDFEKKLAVYAKTGKLADLPKNHQTPILFSRMKSIQVNPIWNIPVSIARSEIYWQAVRDPYYLSNNNIKAYYKGQLVEDTDTIQWSRYSREKLPFKFKQGSGSGNALGKFKFIFESGSSIYLHDTNNKSAFSRSNRAISHGCVRVERPLELAEKLVGTQAEYDRLRMEVNLPPLDTTKMALYKKILAKKADTSKLFKLKPKGFSPKKEIPIILNYKTAWVQNGRIEYRKDVYDLDETLWIAMKKFM